MGVRIGTGQGTAGDSPSGIDHLLGAGVDYLCFESLAELVMGRLTEARAQDPEAGYAPDIGQYLRKALPAVAEGRVKIVSNAGGLNPAGAARLTARIARELGLSGIRIATVTGDDLYPRLNALRAAGADLRNMDTGDGFETFPSPPLFASAYLGAQPVVEGLARGANVVLTGRVTDATIFMAPLIHEFGWSFADSDLLAAGVLIGHLLECSGQVAGGNYSGPDWFATPDPWNVPFPIAEVEADGSAILTKPDTCGGRVSFDTVRRQLLYEVADPARYMNPDVVADFTSARVDDLGDNRVRVSEVRGAPAPDSYKVLLGYDTGWGGEIRVALNFPHAWEKARAAAAIFKKRVLDAGHEVLEWRVEYIGLDALGGPTVPNPQVPPQELLLRVAFRCPDEATALAVRAELTPIYLSAPAAGVGVIHSLTGQGRQPSALHALWPTRVPKALIDPDVVVTLGDAANGQWQEEETV